MKHYVLRVFVSPMDPEWRPGDGLILDEIVGTEKGNYWYNAEDAEAAKYLLHAALSNHLDSNNFLVQVNVCELQPMQLDALLTPVRAKAAFRAGQLAGEKSKTGGKLSIEDLEAASQQ